MACSADVGSDDEKLVYLSIGEAQQLAHEVLEKIGLSGEELEIVQDHIIDAGLCGYDFLSLPRLLTLAREVSKRPAPGPIRIIRETPLSTVLDGANNCGCLAVYRGMELAIKKAKEHGMSIVGVNNSFLSGRSGYYVERIAQQGLIGIHWAGADAKVAPFGGTRPILGTNPIAFGIPASEGPVVFDIGTSAIMWGQVELAARTGKPLPSDTALDAEGHPTVDPSQVLGGALLPFGGHKGYGLSLIVQMLGLLSGSFSARGYLADYGFVHLVIDPDLMLDAQEFREEVDGLIEQVKSAKRIDSNSEIRIPGERSRRERENRLRSGFAISTTVLDALHSL